MGYPSDMTDAQWQYIEELLPKVKERGTKRKHAKRSLMDAIFYLAKTGCQWRYIPSDYPPWQSVYRFFKDLEFRGVFDQLNDSLRKEIRKLEGRKESPSLVSIDSQSVKGDINLNEKGIDGHKKIKGRKRHIVVDVLGLVLMCAVPAANTAYIHPAREFVKKLEDEPRLEKVLVDKAYTGLGIPSEKFSIEVSSKKPEQKEFVPIHKRWVVERTFSWLNRQRRLCRDYEVCTENQKAMILVVMTKIMLNRIGKNDAAKLS